MPRVVRIMIMPLDMPSDSFCSRMSDIFSPQGLLSKVKNFEYRQQQHDMGRLVAEHLHQKKHLVVEAGTGVGKSLAYLIPSIYYAVENRSKALVCTHTINLQQQVFQKDIPLLEKILDVDFKASLLIGRSNYICPMRLNRVLQSRNELFKSDQMMELDRIERWFKTTKVGTRQDMDPMPDYSVWEEVCSEPHVCTPKTCGEDERCFYQMARKAWIASDVVIMNHMLFFSCIKGSETAEDKPSTGYIFPNDFVIFDEAHCIEQAASKHLGDGLNSRGLQMLLGRIYNDTTSKGLISALLNSSLHKLVTHVKDEAQKFFLHAEGLFDDVKGVEVRVREPYIIQNTLSEPINELRVGLAELVATKHMQDDPKTPEIKNCISKLDDALFCVKEFLSQGRENTVYWAEKRGTRGDIIQLNMAPIDLAPILEKLLFKDGNSAIFTSATLSIGRTLDYFKTRVGGTNADTAQLGSPYNYARQMKVLIPKDMPEPSHPDYDAACAAWIKILVKQTDGAALVLFTSKSALKTMAGMLRPWFESCGIELLTQEDQASRSKLLDNFKKDKRSVLFGLDSFWQGVDVPGEALKNVIIPKLPFMVPDHPMIEAQTDSIREKGGNPFRDYTLPEAILKMKQGVGRLIRKETDEGIVAILDKRILSKHYGKMFRDNLPPCPVLFVKQTGDGGFSKV